MNVNLTNASAFMATHARLLDRRRLDLALGNGRPGEALSALAAYRNADGGYGSALEPDLRSASSQPVGALHAFEVFEEIGPATSPHATELCDWLASITLADGGLPFALPIADAAGCAPFWTQADPSTSSLHLTAAVAGIAQRVARHDQGVREHPWLARATGYCLRQIAALDKPGHALELLYALQFLDAVQEARPDTADELRRLGGFLPASGTMGVEGGLADEAVRPLDFSPRPGRPLRELFAAEVVAVELDRLAGAQQDDGGWTVDFASYSPAGALEWRGYATVRAVTILQAHQRT
jgi:hypothetical protein